MLYQTEPLPDYLLLYIKDNNNLFSKWCARRDSNPQPFDP
ncbi:protein of unknown function [Mycoplasma capricolum subsp. capripneumoniae]|nr:protein of unknown function [Mycoplasma capricolum subsp. capripneumoniae]